MRTLNLIASRSVATGVLGAIRSPGRTSSTSIGSRGGPQGLASRKRASCRQARLWRQRCLRHDCHFEFFERGLRLAIAGFRGGRSLRPIAAGAIDPACGRNYACCQKPFSSWHRRVALLFENKIFFGQCIVRWASRRARTSSRLHGRGRLARRQYLPWRYPSSAGRIRFCLGAAARASAISPDGSHAAPFPRWRAIAQRSRRQFFSSKVIKTARLRRDALANQDLINAPTDFRADANGCGLQRCRKPWRTVALQHSRGIHREPMRRDDENGISNLRFMASFSNANYPATESRRRAFRGASPVQSTSKASSIREKQSGIA